MGHGSNSRDFASDARAVSLWVGKAGSGQYAPTPSTAAGYGVRCGGWAADELVSLLGIRYGGALIVFNAAWCGRMVRAQSKQFDANKPNLSGLKHVAASAAGWWASRGMALA